MLLHNENNFHKEDRKIHKEDGKISDSILEGQHWNNILGK